MSLQKSARKKNFYTRETYPIFGSSKKQARIYEVFIAALKWTLFIDLFLCHKA